jgi:hypothetical protein
VVLTGSLSLDGGVWARRGVRFVAADAALGLARWRAGSLRLALWSGAFRCLLARARLARHRMKRRLRHLRGCEEGGGRVLGSSVVAKWRHFAAECLLLALRKRSVVLARIEMRMEASEVVAGTEVS